MAPRVRSLSTWILVLVLLAGAGYLLVAYYEFLFSEKIEGKISRVERVTSPNAIISTGGGSVPNEQVFSFAIGIETKDGTVRTASSEDRQWAVASVGQCVLARFFPYPPWRLDKAGTYHSARLLELRNCP